jgi:site-specific recombinase XerD
VIGKGNRERVVPIERAFFDEAAAYLRGERPAGCSTPECFVVLRGPTTGRLDLRGWITWLDAAFLDPFAVERAHIELCARWCKSEGKARSTIGRRLSTICGFYKYCSQERLIERDPSAHVRRPKQDYESSTLGLDRNELGAFLVQAGLCGGRDHALACLLALNGLRISEALGADIDNLDVNRGHRTLFIHRKGNRPPRSRCRREQRGPSISTSANENRVQSSCTTTARVDSIGTRRLGSCDG